LGVLFVVSGGGVKGVSGGAVGAAGGAAVDDGCSGILARRSSNAEPARIRRDMRAFGRAVIRSDLHGVVPV
jgi:hypothetical protein